MKRFAILVDALAVCALLLPLQAVAQAWPVKPVRIIVPYPVGGTSDILSRTLGQKRSEVWGQSVIVENKAGANGQRGRGLTVTKAPADGYTPLLCDVGALAISPSVYTSLGFDPNKDFAPVTMVAYSPHILAVNPEIPVKFE
jgi:tripartite-type tricarboxylate transporter receptor subunit TctC